MAEDIKCLLVVGARPNFMKMAPLIRALEQHNTQARSGQPQFESILVHTGQHYDANMSRRFFDELGIRSPDHNLNVGSGTHATQTAEVMMGLEPLCEEERPDWVIVVGDVNSTVAATLTAVKLGCRVAHVEAGLRSWDRTMPEEINRIVTDALSDLLLTPSDDADENLRREGIPPERIKQVGNIMIDSLVANLAAAKRCPVGHDLGVEPGRFVYVTLHRPSNVDTSERLAHIMATLDDASKDLPVVFPLHPRTLARIQEFNIATSGNGRFMLIDPVGYHESIWLCQNARLILTDSGGLQEESTFFRTPCLTLRANTERPITISRGSNRLTTLEGIETDIQQSLTGEDRLGSCPALWDGHTGRRITELLAEMG